MPFAYAHYVGVVEMSIFARLSLEELEVLRRIVKNVHFKNYPLEFITDREADKLIDSLADQTVENLIKLGVDRRVGEL